MASFPYRRIAVIGGPGGGKSWLSRRLGARLGLPVYHLDKAFWRPGWVEAPHAEYVAQQQDWVDQQQWIIDGNYTGTLAMRLARAEAVIWVSPPTWQCVVGIARRWWFDTERPDTPDACPDQFDWKFLLYTMHFRRTRGPKLRRAQEAFDGYWLTLESRSQAESFVDSVGAPPLADRVTLPDGTEVTIRPLATADREVFVQGFAGASPTTIRERFHQSNFRLTESRIDYLTQVDQVDHFALGACVLENGQEHGIAIARCFRNPDGHSAELAVTVTDNYQRQGLGSILVDRLEEMVRHAGINAFTGVVDAERRDLLSALRVRGFTIEHVGDGLTSVSRTFA